MQTITKPCYYNFLVKIYIVTNIINLSINELTIINMENKLWRLKVHTQCMPIQLMCIKSSEYIILYFTLFG